jgi:hypothetical protein
MAIGTWETLPHGTGVFSRVNLTDGADGRGGGIGGTRGRVGCGARKICPSVSPGPNLVGFVNTLRPRRETRRNARAHVPRTCRTLHGQGFWTLDSGIEEGRRPGSMRIWCRGRTWCQDRRPAWCAERIGSPLGHQRVRAAAMIVGLSDWSAVAVADRQAPVEPSRRPPLPAIAM